MNFKVPMDSIFLEKLLIWAESKYEYVAFFTDNDIPYPFGGYKNRLYAGNHKVNITDLHISDQEAIGIISYDYKNRIENLQSTNQAIIDHPDDIFFLPEIKIYLGEDYINFEDPLAEDYFKEINNTRVHKFTCEICEIIPLTSREQYLDNVNQIRQHIIEGDVYEMNYCIGFTSEIKKIYPQKMFLMLLELSPMPFSVYFKANDQVLLCASPERFLKKEADSIIAQPIKGTIKRGNTSYEDEQYKSLLLNSEKERSENLMIVDLMRNDLSKISVTGSVKVEELFGIYSFQHIHQMISTVTSIIEASLPLVKIMQNTFPMGSMTGAPKIKCMELIDRYENFRRGWFSGTVGYVDENGNFDFNVIIRSIFLDLSTMKLMFAVGSAITYDANAEQEYEECLLKAKSIFHILNNPSLTD